MADSQPEPKQYWVIYDSGAAARIEAIGAQPPTLNPPGRIVSEEEYRQHVRPLHDAHRAHIAGLAEQDTTAQREDYTALVGAGVPEATARRMSGYTPVPAGETQ